MKLRAAHLGVLLKIPNSVGKVAREGYIGGRSPPNTSTIKVAQKANRAHTLLKHQNLGLKLQVYNNLKINSHLHLLGGEHSKGLRSCAKLPIVICHIKTAPLVGRGRKGATAKLH